MKSTTKKKLSAWDIFHQGNAPIIQSGSFQLGPNATYDMLHDPKHLCFTLARYKFIAKILEGKKDALEIGCGDCFGTPIVAQSVSQVHCIDWTEHYINDCSKRLADFTNISFEVLDFNRDFSNTPFESAYLVDVIEHIDPDNESVFLSNICQSLTPQGVLVVGTPNKTAACYASETSNNMHINLHDHQTLKTIMRNYFHNTFMFSMNDEVIHTGFSAMGHYIFAIGCGVKPL